MWSISSVTGSSSEDKESEEKEKEKDDGRSRGEKIGDRGGGSREGGGRGGGRSKGQSPRVFYKTTNLTHTMSCSNILICVCIRFCRPSVGPSVGTVLFSNDEFGRF